MMDLYSSLPENTGLPGVQLKKKKKRQEFVQEFLKQVVPAKRKVTGDLDVLKHKTQMLDAVTKTWSKTKNSRKRNVLSCREKRELKLFDIPSEGHRFDDYLTLHRMWQDYMRDILSFDRLIVERSSASRQNHERLLKADYHGCMVTVKKTKCPSLLGLSGIILMETRNMFKIITKDSRMKCLPKENSIFAFQLDGFLFTIHGNHFRVKTSERVRRKFKEKSTTDF